MTKRAAEFPRRATYQDVLDAPPNMVAEVVGGTLVTHPRPAAPHARASSGLGAKIGGPFDFDRDGPGGWWIIDEPELHLGDDILVPNVAGWRRVTLWSGLASSPQIKVHRDARIDVPLRPRFIVPPPEGIDTDIGVVSLIKQVVDAHKG